jgi:hypothetical protein
MKPRRMFVAMDDLWVGIWTQDFCSSNRNSHVAFWRTFRIIAWLGNFSSYVERIYCLRPTILIIKGLVRQTVLFARAAGLFRGNTRRRSRGHIWNAPRGPCDMPGCSWAYTGRNKQNLIIPRREILQYYWKTEGMKEPSTVKWNTQRKRILCVKMEGKLNK